MDAEDVKKAAEVLARLERIRDVKLRIGGSDKIVFQAHGLRAQEVVETGTWPEHELGGVAAQAKRAAIQELEVMEGDLVRALREYDVSGVDHP